MKLNVCVSAGLLYWWRLSVQNFIPKRKRGERPLEDITPSDTYPYRSLSPPSSRHWYPDGTPPQAPTHLPPLVPAPKTPQPTTPPPDPAEKSFVSDPGSSPVP